MHQSELNSERLLHYNSIPLFELKCKQGANSNCMSHCVAVMSSQRQNRQSFNNNLHRITRTYNTKMTRNTTEETKDLNTKEVVMNLTETGA